MGKFLSPRNTLVLMMVWIFLAELGDMTLLAILPPLSLGVEAIVDSVFLLVILSPSYFLLYRPFKALWHNHLNTLEEVRRLSWELISTAETERKHLAHELHDEVGQVLTTLHLGLETLRDTPAVAATERQRQFQRLLDLSAKLSDQIHDVAVGLRPAMLDDLGLVPTLRWHVGQHVKNWGDTQVNFQEDGIEERLPSEVELALFRICQESLNNIGKHARAGRVMIRLARAQKQVVLSIKDDGVGFVPDRQRHAEDENPRIGLLGMRERVNSLGGTLEIISSPGTGTLIQANLPLVRS